MDNREINNCLNCNRTENTVPLLAVRYSGKDAFVCSDCLPQLIHHRENLTEKLKETAEK